MPKKQTKTELPRGYISWSQLDLVEKSPQKYIERYIYGDQDEESENMRFGTEVHARLANGKEEEEITCVINRGKQKVKLLGKLDNSDGEVDIEYKTSTKLWSEKKAKQHGQMKFYALIRYKNTGKIPKQKLVCMETANMGDMILTGEQRTFDIQYTLKDMLEMEARIWKAHDKIIDLVNRELSTIF